MTHKTKMEYRDSQAAFSDAIATGELSDDPSSQRYAGDYMYMCTVNGADQFKHSVTRQYLTSLTPGFTAHRMQ